MSASRIVRVVSEHHEGGGGFWWFPESATKEYVDAYFDREVKAWAGEGSIIRLVNVEVDPRLSDEGVTDYIDSELLDCIESEMPAIREATAA